MEESAVPDQQDVFVISMFQRFNERQEAVSYVHETFTGCWFACIVVAQYPILVIPAVLFPTLLIRFSFEIAAVVFPKCLCDLIWQIECPRDDIRCFFRPQNGAGEYGGYGNIPEVVRQDYCLFLARFRQTKMTLAIRDHILCIRFTFTMPDEVEFHKNLLLKARCCKLEQLLIEHLRFAHVGCMGPTRDHNQLSLFH